MKEEEFDRMRELYNKARYKKRLTAKESLELNKLLKQGSKCKLPKQ